MDELGFDDIVQDLKRVGLFLTSVNTDEVKNILAADGHGTFRGELTEWEYAYLEKLKIPKRKSDFLSGRLAGKEAVKELLRETRDVSHGTGGPGSRRIGIKRLESGVPELTIDDRAPDIVISISHSGETAVSITGSRKIFRGIGVDMEMIEKRDNSFFRIAFTEDEISKITETGRNSDGSDDETITRYWTIKEAVLKSMGSGLNLNLKDIEIESGSEGPRGIKLKNEALRIFQTMGGTGPHFRSYRTGRFIITVAWIT